MKKLLVGLKNLFKKKQPEYYHLACTVQKDKSGHWRRHIFINGTLVRQEMTIEFWISDPQAKSFLKEK